jgi:hypothetical protein
VKSKRCVVSASRARERHPFHVAQPAGDDLVGALLNPAGGLCIRRTAVGAVVLEAAVLGRVVRRRDDDSVGKAGGAAPVVRQHGVRERGGGRVAVARIDHDVDLVRREHLQRAAERRLREGVRVDAEEDGAVDLLLAPVLTDRLRDGEDVRFGEHRVQRRAAMTGCAEGDPLLGLVRVGMLRVVGRDEARDVGEHRGLGGLTGTWVDGHRLSW